MKCSLSICCHCRDAIAGNVDDDCGDDDDDKDDDYDDNNSVDIVTKWTKTKLPKNKFMDQSFWHTLTECGQTQQKVRM